MKILKVIILLSLYFGSLQNLNAQIPPPGSYTTNTTMGAFHGTWMWTSGIDTVKIYLATKPIYYPISGGFYADRLVGWHLYKRGSLVIESSYNHLNDVEAQTILGGTNEVPITAKCFFKDITRNKDCELSLTINTAQNQLSWRLTEHKGLRVYGNGNTVPPSGLTLPRNILLTKL